LTGKDLFEGLSYPDSPGQRRGGIQVS